MAFGEIVFYLLISGIVIHLLYKFLFEKSQKEYNEYEKNIKLRLNDDKIYDPETGVKMTLEQAQKGTWIKNDNFSRIRTEEEIDTYFDGVEKEIEKIANNLKSRNFKHTKISNKYIKVLEKTHMLSKYDDWTYYNAFNLNDDDKVLFPEVQYHYRGKGTSSFTGIQIMFWLKIEDIGGHYFLREKETHEKILDLFRRDDDFKFGNFEVFTIIKSTNIKKIISTLSPFEKLKNIEIEIRNNDLFIKTTNQPNISEFNKLLNFIETKTYYNFS